MLYFIYTKEKELINMTKLNLDTFEVITSITTTYQEEIENYLLEEDDEILQIEVAEIVMSLYHAYMEDQTNDSLLNLINKKHITLNEIL